MIPLLEGCPQRKEILFDVAACIAARIPTQVPRDSLYCALNLGFGLRRQHMISTEPPNPSLKCPNRIMQGDQTALFFPSSNLFDLNGHTFTHTLHVEILAVLLNQIIGDAIEIPLADQAVRHDAFWNLPP